MKWNSNLAGFMAGELCLPVMSFVQRALCASTWVASVAIVVAACSSDSTPSQSLKVYRKVIAASVGGDIKTDNGASLDLLPGALATDTEVVIAVGQPKPTLPELASIDGPTYDITPSGITFGAAATLTLPVTNTDPQRSPVVSKFDDKSKVWRDAGVTYLRYGLTVSITETGLYAVRLLGGNGGGTGGMGGGCGEGTGGSSGTGGSGIVTCPQLSDCTQRNCGVRWDDCYGEANGQLGLCAKYFKCIEACNCEATCVQACPMLQGCTSCASAVSPCISDICATEISQCSMPEYSRLSARQNIRPRY